MSCETSNEMFAYQWTYDDMNFNVFGLDCNNNTVCLKVHGFTPYVYIELNPDVNWSQCIGQLSEKIEYSLKFKPVKKALVYKRKLYYSHKDNNGTDKKFPYLFMAFERRSHINSLRWMKPVTIPGVVANMQVKVHESDATPLLQLTCMRNIDPTGWIKFEGVSVEENEKETRCCKEYNVFWKKIFPSTQTTIPDILVMSFDIECYSSVPSAMPSVDRPEDKIFQISIVLSNSKQSRKYLLSLGDPDQTIVECTVLKYNTEHELLDGYSQLVRKEMPQVVIGYNIFGFDIPYMIGRAKQTMCLSSFDQQGYIVGEHAVQRTINWSSSAFQDQHFEFLDVNGIIFVDLLPLIKRDYKFDNYKLSTVSQNILKNQTKDPLTPADIFNCYRTFTSKSLGIVGKYCVQDSLLVSNLFNVTQTWIGLCEMSKTCNVPIFSLYTQGQQIKVFSQVYKYCLYNNIVVEKYTHPGNDTYSGAYVVDPDPGVYDNVVPFDFASLYPTTIIAYNIDYSTMVIDETVPDSECNVIEWEDHIGCVHDTSGKVVPKEKVMCGAHKFRFYKNGLGVIPSIIKNLLDARKQVNTQIKKLKAEGGSQELIAILDKRQLSYKVSANSVYGAMGVRRGYLPFMPAAMCTTAMGRKSIIKASEYIKNVFGGQIVYGDTDSTMVMFNEQNIEKLWDLCVRIEKEVSELFPAPMRLAFEEKIYKRFFILTKKRYIAQECGKDGVFKGKITKKGILLARRDNSKMVRNIYEKTIMSVLSNGTPDVSNVIDLINEMFYKTYTSKDYVITKGINDVSSYKVRDLPSDELKKTKRLTELKCTENEYHDKSLPAHIQLAERMRSRGTRVDVGTRLEYVITCNGTRLSEKVEDIEYFDRHSDILRIDNLYYLKLLVNPIDQILNVTIPEKDLVSKMYTQHKNKYKLCQEIKELSEPIIL